MYNRLSIYSSAAVRRARHYTLAGANPARLLSLQPVAAGAVDGGNDRDGSTPMRGVAKALGDPAGRNARERRAGFERGDAEADPPATRGKRVSGGKRATRAPADSAGVMAAARREEGGGARHGKPRRWHGTCPPAVCEGQAGPYGVAERPVVLMKPGNAGGGKGPCRKYRALGIPCLRDRMAQTAALRVRSPMRISHPR